MTKVTPAFATIVAQMLGAPVDRTYQILSQWEPYEGLLSNGNNNPLGTTQNPSDGQGVTGTFNSAGVKMFKDEATGARTTAETLLNGYYPAIVNWLRTGNLDAPAVANQVRIWGTTGFANQIDGGAAPAAGGSGAMPSSDWYNRYAAVYPRYQELKAKYDQDTFAADTIDNNPKSPNYGRPKGPGSVLTPAEAAEYATISQKVQDLEAEAEQAGADAKDAIEKAKWDYSTDPKNIDAENAANKFARELDVRQQATSLANQQFSEQERRQESAVKGVNEWARGHAAGESVELPNQYLPTATDLYDRAVQTVKKGLPDVPGAPYFSDAQRSAGRNTAPNLGAARTQSVVDAHTTVIPPYDPSKNPPLNFVDDHGVPILAPTLGATTAPTPVTKPPSVYGVSISPSILNKIKNPTAPKLGGVDRFFKWGN